MQRLFSSINSYEMSDNEAIEAIEENIEEPLTKPKKPRSQKQVEAFEKVKEKRRTNIEAKKQQKLLESAKLLIETHQPQTPQTQPKNGKNRIVAEPEPMEEESDVEEIVVVKKSKQLKAKPKPKRRIIVVESSSDEESDDEDEYEPEPEPEPVKSRKVRRSQSSSYPVIHRQPSDFSNIFC